MTNLKEECKEMKLRCVMKKTDKGYVGVCLELSLAIRGKTFAECRDNLEHLIDDYIDTINELHQKRENVVLRPIKWYYLNKIVFDLKMYYYLIMSKDNSKAGFTQKRVVFVGV